MEHQTRYDLNAAIANWRQKLACESGLAPEIRCELETHLRDSIAGFEERGLTAEEAFWLAGRRMGEPGQLREEFAKANPSAIWRERLYWMTLSLVGSYLFMTWKDLLGTWVNPKRFGWVEIGYLIPIAVLIASVVIIRRGKIPSPVRPGRVASWKLLSGMLAILIATVVTAYYRGQSLAEDGNGDASLMGVGLAIGMLLSWLGNAVWPTVMVLILLFTQKRNEKSVLEG